MKLRFHHLAILSLLALVPGAAAAGTSDAWLSTKVKIALLTSKDVPNSDIDVDVVRGTVTLHGKVESEAEKTRSEQVARKVDGVKGLRNLLQVVPEHREKAVKADDKVIEASVKRSLGNDPALADSDIKVKSVNNGVVLLSGEAKSVSDQLRALAHARRTEGVVEVASEMKSPDRLADEEIWRRRSTTPAKLEGGVTGAVSDMWITSDIKMRLIADSETPALDINVDTRDGVVTLFGMVPTSSAKAAAEANARQVDGVKKVVNALQVVPASKQEAVKAADGDLQNEISKMLKADPDLTGSNINVEVKDGVVRLTGSVRSENDRLVAAISARSVAGVRAVRDELKVDTAKAAL